MYNSAEDGFKRKEFYYDVNDLKYDFETDKGWKNKKKYHVVMSCGKEHVTDIVLRFHEVKAR